MKLLGKKSNSSHHILQKQGINRRRKFYQIEEIGVLCAKLQDQLSLGMELFSSRNSQKGKT